MVDESGQEEEIQTSIEIQNDPNIVITRIEIQNSSILHDLRKRIDKVDDNRLVTEVRKYSDGEGGGEAVIALDGFTPAGYLEMIPSEERPTGAKPTEGLDEYAHIARVGVLEEKRGRGIGKKLMQEAEKRALELGKRGLWLDYLVGNERARALYESLGYSSVQVFTDTDGRDRVLAKKELKNADAEKPDGVKNNETKAQNEKLQGEQVPRTIVQEVENYLINGRPGLNGRLENNFSANVSRNKEAGSRAGLCGYAAPYASEVAEELIESERCKLAACTIQANLLGKIVPDNLFHIYRQHGFSIVVDRDLEKWWIIDTTLNQFVEKTDNGNLRMFGSGIGIDNHDKSRAAEVARNLLENGFVEMTRENLAAYVTLMVKRDRVDSNYTEEVSKSFLRRTTFTLDDLVTRCIEQKRWKVGDWNGSLRQSPWL